MHLRQIIKLAWPIMASVFLQSLLGTVDMFFITKLGTQYAAAASLGTSTYGTITLLSVLVSTGVVAVASRYYGSRDIDSCSNTSYAGLIMAASLGLVIGLISLVFSKQILMTLYDPEESVLLLSKAYLTPIFAGMVFIFISSSLRSSLHSIGDTLTPLKVFGAANVLNAILDPLLMFGLKMGIAGASTATVISTFLATIIIFISVQKNIFRKHKPVFKITLAKEIVSIGFWDLLQQMARPITGMIMFRMVYKIGGAPSVAAFGIGGQMFSYAFIILAGVSMALSIMSGHRLGSGNISEIRDIVSPGFKISLVNILLFSIPYFFLPSLMFRIFTSDPLVVSTGTAYLKIIYVGLIFVIFPTVYGGVLRGLGRTFESMFSSVAANVLYKLPISYLLATQLMGTNGIWLGVSTSVLIEAIIVKAMYEYRIRKLVS